MAPGEYMAPGYRKCTHWPITTAVTASGIGIQGPQVYYVRNFSDDGLVDETRTWKEAVAEEAQPLPELPADSRRPFAVSPRQRVKAYVQAAKCRLTVYRSEVRFAERKATKP